MRKFMFLLSLMVSTGLAFGQAQVSGNITAQGTTCGTTNACVTLTAPSGTSTALIQLSGTFNATVQFEITADGTNWVAALGTVVGSTSTATSATAAGAWRVTASAANSVRVRCSTFSTGAVVVQINASTGASGGGGGGGSGTVTSVTFTGDGTVLSSTPSSAVTTTGTLTAALANAAAGTLLDNATGSSAAPTYTASPILGVDGTTAGTVQLANASAAFHSVLGSAATANNTVNLPVSVPSTTDIITCVTASTTCTLNDSGITATGGIIGLPAGGSIATGDTGAPSIVGSANTLTSNVNLVAPSFTSNGSNAGIWGCAQGATQAIVALNIGIQCPTSVQAAGYLLSLPGTEPVANNVLTIASIASHIAVGSWTTPSAGALNTITGSAAQATITETAPLHQVTFAGVETAALTYPHVFQNTNSTNNNSSGAIIANTVGTSTGQVPVVLNESTSAGDFLDAYNGGTVTNGVISGGTLKFSVGPTGTLTIGSGANTATMQNILTNNPVLIQGGIDGAATGAAATVTVRGEDITSGSTATIAGGAATLRGGNSASTGNSQTGGAVQINGGDVTGGTGTSDAAGGVTIRGGNYSGAAASGTGGAVSIAAGGVTGASTNLLGADTTISSGLGTGNAVASHTFLQQPTYSQTSGTTAQTLVKTFAVLKKAGSTTTATATNMFSIANASSTAGSVLIFVGVHTQQAAPSSCSDSGVFEMAYQGDTSPTASVNRVDATVTTICSTGTMTFTAAVTNANPTVFSVTPSWTTIVPTAVWIEVSILNPSDVDITPIGD